MESVWLLLGGGRDAVRRPGLGFLGTSPFRCENPRFWGLEKLGFPWILSSESRLINGLHEIFSERFFLALLSSRMSRRNGEPPIWYAKRTDCSWGKLNVISDFLQEIAARAVPACLPPSKSSARQGQDSIGSCPLRANSVAGRLGERVTSTCIGRRADLTSSSVRTWA